MNWDKIEQLLNIVDKARQWPTLRHIHDAAMQELAKKPEEPQPEVAQPRSFTGGRASEPIPGSVEDVKRRTIQPKDGDD